MQASSLIRSRKDREVEQDVAVQIALATPDDVPALADVLVDCVAGGASVGFLAPLPLPDATAFWEGELRASGTTLVARLAPGAPAVGVVQLHPARLPNGAHRGEVAKLLVHRRARGRGVAGALMRAVEDRARAAGRWLLLLDTETGSPAQGFYERRGWQVLGVLQDHAVRPHGGLAPTTFLFKRLSDAAPPAAR